MGAYLAGRASPWSLLRIPGQSSVREQEESERLAQAVGREAWAVCSEPLGEAPQGQEGVHRTGARRWGPVHRRPSGGGSVRMRQGCRARGLDVVALRSKAGGDCV